MAIFMISSASASENVTLNDSPDEVMGDVESSVESTDDVLEVGDEESALKDNGTQTGTEKLNIDAKFDSEYILEDYYNYFYVHLPRAAAKDVSIYIDGSLTGIKIDGYIDEEPLYEMNFVKLGLGVGKHNITFSHPGDSRYAPVNKTYALNIVHFHAFIPKTNWGDESYIIVRLSDYNNGIISVIVDGKVKSKRKTETLLDDDYIYMPSVSYGTHNVEVRYEGALGTYSATGKYVCSYVEMGIEDGMIFSWQDLDLYLYGDYGFSKKVTVKIGGKTLKAKLNHGDGSLSIPKSLLKIGKNTITLSYSGDSKYPAYSKKVVFNVIPNLLYPHKYDINDKESIVIKYPSATKASYVIYEVKQSKEDFVDDVLTKIKSGSVNGKFIYLPELTAGTHLLYFNYTTSDGFTYGDYFTVVVKKNTAGLSSGISKKTVKYGQEIKVKVKSPKLNAKAYVYVDGKKVKSISLKKGTASDYIQMLSQGKHKVKVYVSSGKKFHSKVYYVTVKKPTSLLTLKTVKVKKSAKKLVLKATLKNPNKKPIKGKRLTFKFNGKTYKAKTNKNGVAKVTVKKSALKRLKVGKTVDYQVKYQYTLKKSAKIKK